MLNKSIDLVTGFFADICIYNLKQSSSSDCGQFITGSLKNVACAFSISTCGVEMKAALNCLLCPLDPGTQKYPDVTHSPEGLARILGSVPMQRLLRPPDLVARVRGTFLFWAEVETELLPSFCWGRG